MTKVQPWMRFVFILLVVQLVSFRLFIHKTGFFLDDWVLLEFLREADGFWALINYLGSLFFIVRPVGLVGYAIVYTLSAPNPMVGQLILVVLDCLEAFFFFLVLHKLLNCRRLAFLAAVLVMICPVREAIHFWLTTSVNVAAHIFLLASFLCHMEWLRSRSRVQLVGGQVLYAVGFLSYEAIGFLPLILLAGLAAQRRFSGKTMKESMKSAFIDMLPYAIPFVLAVLWQWKGAKFLLAADNPKSISPSFSHAFSVYWSGLQCLTTALVENCMLNFSAAWDYFSAPHVVLWASFTGGLVWVLHEKPEAGNISIKSLKILLVVMGTTFFASYLPFALSGQYEPQIWGVMSRTNGSGAWVCGSLLAGLITALGPKSPWAQNLRYPAIISNSLLLLVIGSFTWTNWYSSRAWSVAWETQQKIMSRLLVETHKVPAGGVLMVRGFPTQAGTAPVISNDQYDFHHALKYATKRSDIRGGVATPWFKWSSLKNKEKFLFDSKADKLFKVVGHSEGRLKLLSLDGSSPKKERLNIPRAAFPKGQPLAVGTTLEVETRGKVFKGDIVSLDATTVVVEVIRK